MQRAYQWCVTCMQDMSSRLSVQSPGYGKLLLELAPVLRLEQCTLGSLMRAHMLPTILAAFFLASPDLSRRPLCTTGTMSAKLGASTVLMNTVWSRVSSAGLACLLGLAMASSRGLTRLCTSGLRMTPPICSARHHTHMWDVSLIHDCGASLLCTQLDIVPTMLCSYVGLQLGHTRGLNNIL